MAKAIKHPKLGDVVTLRSDNGPNMVIVATSKENETRVCCGWFNHSADYLSEWFHVDALQQN